MLRIDCHTHLLPSHLPDWSKKFGYGDFIRLEHSRPGFANMMKGDRFFREIAANCWDPAIRVEEYSTWKTKVQVVSTIPVMFSYWAKTADALDLSKFLNDHLAEVVSGDPTHYIGLGTVPMQDTDAAINELERCRSIGLIGVQIGSNVNKLNLNEPRFLPFFEACERLGMPLLIHPWEMMGEQDMQRYWLPWLVGMPAETTRAMCSMIFGGIFDRYPQLRVNFAHAGGSFFPTFGRIAHGFNSRPDLVAIDNPTDPRSYFGKFWVDCITHDPDLLRMVLRHQGSKRVTLGSDYPFPLGDLEIGAFIEHMDLSQDVQQDIYCNAGAEWLGIDPTAYE